MKNKHEELVVCPVCRGEAKIIKDTKTSTLQSMKKAVEVLVAQGWSIRNIQRVMGYKSPQSISHILYYQSKKQNKTGEEINE